MKNIKVNLGKEVREIAISDAKAKRVEEALLQNYGYKERIPNPDPQPSEGEEGHDTWQEEIDNPQEADDFVKDQIKRFLEESVIAFEANKAAEEARQTVLDDNFNLN